MDKKQYDLMMNMVGNQQASFADFTAAGLNVENTSLQDIQVYRDDPYIKEQFTDELGNFNEMKFQSVYNQAQSNYNVMANNSYDDIMRSQLSFHRSNIDVPYEMRRKGPDYQEVFMVNPQKITSSVIHLGEMGERTLSDDELAQSNKVLLNPTEVEKSGDWSKAKWGDSPNESFFSNFWDTLVLAQWDSDGDHPDPVTGEMVQHQKGELKINDEGTYYYEKLDGRDIYGRRVLNKMNILTTDGSWLNQYDFFDSDDINQKSIGGSVLKNLALVGTMFIPYVGPWITGLSLATQLAGVGATLGKMIVGSDSPTLSAIEGWSKSVNRQGAQTEYAQQNAWCWENFINLIGDVAGQLKEQRFIFEKIPYIFKGANMMSKEGQAAKLAELEKKHMKLANTKIQDLRSSGMKPEDLLKAETELKAVSALKAQSELDSFIKGYNKLGEVLSKGYMTMITVGDTYGEAKAAGASDLDATLLTLGYAAGEYAILNTGIGEWILPELRAGRYRAQAIAKALTKEVDQEAATLRNKFGQQLRNFSKEGKKEYAKKLFDIGRNIARAEYSNGTRTLKATLASGIGEGVEEVSEELLADFSKGCYNTVKWLQGEDTRLNAFGYNFETGEWDLAELRDRYGMSLIGGFVGGGLTNLGTNYKTMNSLGTMNRQQAIQELVYMSRNGESDQFLKEVDKMQLGDKNLSATEVREIDGVLMPSPGTKENNQEVYIKRAIRNQVRMIDNILSANGASISDDSFLDIQTLKDLRFNALHKSTTAGAFLQEFNTLSSKLVVLTKRINDIINSEVDVNNDKQVSDQEERRAGKTLEEKKAKLSPTKLQAVEKAEKELEETKKAIQEFVDGKRSAEFIAESLFEMTTALSGEITLTSFPLYAEAIENRKFSEIPNDRKEVLRKSYETWMTSEGRDRIHLLSQVYRQVAEQSSQVIKEQEQTYLQTPEQLIKINNLIQRLYPKLLSQQEIDKIRKEDPNFFFFENAADQLSLAQDAADSATQNIGLDLANKIGTQQEIDALNEIQGRSPEFTEETTEEEKKEWFENRGKEYFGQLQAIIANNITSYIQPFIDRGFANAETKNQLNQLVARSLNFFKVKAIQWDQNDNNYDALTGEPLEENPYTSIVTKLSQVKEQINNLNNTPIEQNLDQFAISLGEDPIALTALIDRLNLSFNNVSQDITQFNLDDTLYKDLNNAIATLQLYRQAILGARTDAADLGNLYGYNATLNEVTTRLGQGTQLAEINSQVADLFVEDINTNLKKLEFLKKLFEINQGQKLTKQDRVSIKKDLLIYKRLKAIVQVLDDDELNKWEGFLDLQNILNSMPIHQDSLQKNNLALNDETRKKFEEEKLKLEDGIYEFFQKNKDKLEDPNALMQLINPNRLQLYTRATELLNEGLDNIDDNSLVWWLAARAAVKATDFYGQYRQIIDPKAERPLAPIAPQELGIYNNYASVVNGNVFTAFYKAYRQSIKEDWATKSVEERAQIIRNLDPTVTEDSVTLLSSDEFVDQVLNIIAVPKYQNIVLTEGIPGSGKSTGVFQSTLKMLKAFHPELLSNVAVIHGANSDSAKTLRDNIELTANNSKTYGRAEWMKEISPSWTERTPDENGTVRVPKNEITQTEENEIRSSLGIKETTTPPSLIIIDEIFKFSGFDLDQIDKFARKYGITVLTAGDADQTGVVGKAKVDIHGHSNLDWDVSLSRTQFIRSPKLGVSMRTDNQLKTTNLQKFQAYLQNPTQGIELNYYQDETGLFGDKVHMFEVFEDGTTDKNVQADTIIKDVEAMISTLQPGEKIGYIYSDIGSPIYKKLFENYQQYIDFREGGSAQGLEGQYYIVEAGPNPNENVYLKEIYTGMSRSQQGSILIVPSSMNDGAKISHKQLTSKPIGERLKKEVIIPFAEKRKKLLDDIITNPQDVPYFKRTVEENQTNDAPAPPTGDTSSLDNGIDPTSPPSDPTPPPPPTPPTPPAPPVVEPPQGEEITPLSREEIEQRFGEKSKIDNFTVTIDGVEIPLSLDQIPFINTKKESGSNNIINYSKRNIVVVNINGFHMPFYMSTRVGDKIETNDGEWYPFFGIGQDGWFNETNGKEMSKYYDSPIFAAISQKLNEILGTGLQDKILGPLTVDEINEQTPPQIDFINQDMSPCSNNQADTRFIVEQNITDAKSMAEGMVQELKETITPVEDDTPSVQPLIYEDNDAPIVNTDVINELKYREQINNANSEVIIPESTAEDTGSQIPIKMLLHSFNTFETGVLRGPNGEIIKNGSKDRIDSINGLMKIFGEGESFEYYMNKLGDLRSIVYNTSDKAELCQKLQKKLGLQRIYCTFALKSSPYLDQKKRAQGQEFLEKNPTKFAKGASERLEYNYSRDSRSQEVPPKSLVMIVGTAERGDLLELPLLTLSSPFTLLKIKNKDGQRVFPDMYNRYEQLTRDGATIHAISTTLVDEFRSNTKYKELVDLFELFNYTNRSIWYIKDNNWTIGNSLQLLGPQFITKSGYYQDIAGFNYEANMTDEENWITLQDLKNNPQVTILSRVAISKTGRISGIKQPVVKTGHPFILVSFNKDLNTDNKIIDQFIKQQEDPSVRKEVKLMYVLPPKASIKEYIENLHKIINRQHDQAQPIGHLFTSYKLLKILTQDSQFRDRMEQKHPRLLEKVDAAIQKLDSLPNDTARKDELKNPQSWVSEGASTRPVKLAGLLDGALHDFVYSKNTLNQNIGLDNVNEINQSDLRLVEQILGQVGINEVRYCAKLPKTGAEGIGRAKHFLAVTREGDGYSINGLPFRIHGKIDSYTFKGTMGGFIDSIFSRMLTDKNGNQYSIDNFRYLDGQSDLSRPHGRQILNPNDRIIENNIKYVTQKAGNTVGQTLAELYQQGDKSNAAIVEANQKIASQINYEDNGIVAFTIGKELKISNKNDILSGYRANLMMPDGTNITDITNLMDNNGQYSFVINLTDINSSRNFNYYAQFKEDNLELTAMEVDKNQPSIIGLTVTPENFATYSTTAKSLISILPKVEVPLKRIFENAQTYEELITSMNALTFSNKRVARLQALLEKQNLAPEQIALINELIEFENSRDPFKQNEDETNEVCPITIIIKF